METVDTLQREVTPLKNDGSTSKRHQQQSSSCSNSSSRDSENADRSLETSHSSGAGDPTTLGSLRQDTGLQKTTMQRLHELGLEGENTSSDDDMCALTKKGKIKSGQKRTAANKVSHTGKIRS